MSDMGITIHDYSTGDQPTDPQYSTDEMQEVFEVLGFMAPYVLVKRRADGVEGVLQFSHRPRRYWGFEVR